MGDNVVEVVMFDMKTEVARADFLTGAGEASDWLRIQPGQPVPAAPARMIAARSSRDDAPTR